jgi:hypothetical protein
VPCCERRREGRDDQMAHSRSSGIKGFDYEYYRNPRQAIKILLNSIRNSHRYVDRDY